MQISPDLSKLPLAIERSQNKEMLSITEENGQTQVRINYSSLSIIQECPRKAEFTFERGLRAKMDSPATLFGGAIHKALEVFYSAPRERRIIPGGFNENADLMAYGHAAPSSDLLYDCIAAFVLHAEPLRGLADTDKRSLGSGVWMLQNYFKTYIDDPWEVLLDEQGVPYTERRVEKLIFDSPKLKIVIFGTIDVILRNAQTGGVLAADHKTTSMLGNDFYNRLKPNLQYGMYLYLAREILKVDSVGFLVNALEVKSRPLTARGGPPKYIRQVTTRDEEDNEDMLKTIVVLVDQYLHWKENNFFPLGGVNACASYGGCQFLDACQAPKSIRETVIENKFIKLKESV